MLAKRISIGKLREIQRPRLQDELTIRQIKDSLRISSASIRLWHVFPVLLISSSQVIYDCSFGVVSGSLLSTRIMYCKSWHCSRMSPSCFRRSGDCTNIRTLQSCRMQLTCSGLSNGLIGTNAPPAVAAPKKLKTDSNCLGRQQMAIRLLARRSSPILFL